MISRLSSPAFQEQFPGKPYSCQRLPPVNKPAPQPLTVQSQATPQKRNACLKWLCVHTFSWCNQPGLVLAQPSVYCHVVAILLSAEQSYRRHSLCLAQLRYKHIPVKKIIRKFQWETIPLTSTHFLEKFVVQLCWEEIQPSNCLYPGFFLQDAHPQPQICWQMNQLNYLTWKLILKMIGENFILDYLVGCCYQDPAIILTSRATEINFTIPRIPFSSKCVRLLD